MNQILFNKKIDEFLLKSLNEDLNDAGDITTKSIFSEKRNVKAVLISREKGIICGLSIFERIYKLIDSEIKLTFYKDDGKKIKENEIIAVLEGSLHTILACERVSLNFLQRLSGISTLTHKFIERISHTNASILDTRKTTPQYRNFEKYAVKCGGGENHRFGLFDMILIKDNHISGVGSLTKAVEKSLQWLKENNFVFKIEVETKSINQVKEALQLPINRIMLDNMSIKEMQLAVKLNSHKMELEASGNVSLENVHEIAETGVDYISVGAITHSAKSLDLSLLLNEINQYIGGSI